MNFLTSFEYCHQYCNESPFSPGIYYPEYPFNDISTNPNYVYDAVRKHLFNLGLDKDNFGEKSWNPFQEYKLIGKKILIKPNWLKHIHAENETIWCVITHPSFIRVILDYIFIATKGNCTITIGDSPIQEADFNKIVELSKIKEMQSYFNNHNLHFEIEDFRYERAIRNKGGELIKTELLRVDLNRSVAINLFDDSLHKAIDTDYKRYRVTSYNKKEMLNHHRPGHHEYLVNRTAIECDFFINIPKAKTHQKVGVTLSLKNMIGITCSKDWLPHHRQGVKSEHGDEYKNLFFFQWLGVYFIELSEMQKRFLTRKAFLYLSRVFWKMHRAICKVFNLKYYSEGSWYGNDTLWRTCLDINRILFYSNKNGILEENINKDYLTIIDGVIGGEKEGPLRPTPIESNFTVASLNPALADYVATYAMGLDPFKIPVIKYSFLITKYPLCKIKTRDIKVVSSFSELNGSVNNIKNINKFKPSAGWENQIEL
ncbi:MAG TPA: DUF362 domain-containing protein [Ignavibacteria bacterium]